MSLSVHIRKKLNTGTLDVNFDSEDGILAILGETGSGKTTALRCIAGLENPDEGSIILDGKALFDSLHGVNLPAKKRGIGYLSAGGVLNPHKTVGQNLRLALRRQARREGRSVWDEGGGYGRKRRGISARERKLAVTERFPQLLAEYELDGVGGRYPRELSRTQYLMASLACVMAQKPRLLLLDEPFANLDLFQRARMLRRLRGKITPEEDLSEASRPGTGTEGSAFRESRCGIGTVIQDGKGDDAALPRFPHQAVFASSDAEEVYAMSSHVMVISHGVSQPSLAKADFFTSPVTVSAALLSGCTNVTDARTLDPYHAYAPAWGSIFLFREKGEKQKLPIRMRSVGIREHAFLRSIPESADEKEYFRFTVHILRVDDTLTEWKVWFRTGSRAEGELLWQIPKSEITRAQIDAVKRLYVADQDIMRLT